MDNLFSYATTELSNDAFLCWLLSSLKENEEDYLGLDERIKQEDDEVRNTALKVMKKFLGVQSNNILVSDIKKQYQHIDIVILGKVDNKDFVLVIEDKKNAKEHGDQLLRYKDTIEKEFTDCERHFVYFKVGLQPGISNIEEQGYKCFQLDEIHRLISDATGDSDISNNILYDYANYLQDMIIKYFSFEKKK